MRIYTNYDIWNMSKHTLTLGTMTYKKQTYDLDLLEDLYNRYKAPKATDNTLKSHI